MEEQEIDVGCVLNLLRPRLGFGIAGIAVCALGLARKNEVWV